MGGLLWRDDDNMVYGVFAVKLHSEKGACRGEYLAAGAGHLLDAADRRDGARHLACLAQREGDGVIVVGLDEIRPHRDIGHDWGSVSEHHVTRHDANFIPLSEPFFF